MNFLHFKGHAEIVKSLIKSGANPDAMDSSGNLPLFIAVENGNKQKIYVVNVKY